MIAMRAGDFGDEAVGAEKAQLPGHPGRAAAGVFGGLAPKKRGPAPQAKNPLMATVATLEREVSRYKARAERAEALVELQKKVAEFLGTDLQRPDEKG